MSPSVRPPAELSPCHASTRLGAPSPRSGSRLFGGLALLLVLGALLLAVPASAMGASFSTSAASSGAHGPMAPAPCTFRLHVNPRTVALQTAGQSEPLFAYTSCGGTNESAGTTFSWAEAPASVGTLNTSTSEWALFTAAASGNATIWVNATDTTLTATAAAVVPVTVGNPDVDCSTATFQVVTLLPASGGAPGGFPMNTGTSQPFSVSLACFISNGGPPTEYNVTAYSNFTWYASPGIGAITPGAANGATFLATSPGTGIVAVNVTYGAYFFDWVTAAAGPGGAPGQTTITVTGPPVLVATAAANVTTGYAPLTVGFTGGAAGGTTPYTAWAWRLASGVTASTQNTTYTYTAPGAYVVWVNVTDSASATAQSTPLTIHVQAGLSAVASSNVTSGVQPLTVGFSVAATGGSGGNSYVWHFGNGATASTASATYTYATAGTYDAYVSVTDSEPRTVDSNTLAITVNSPTPLTVTIGLSPATITLGGSSTLTANPSGGGGVDSSSWITLPPGCPTTTKASFSCTPSAAGTFLISLIESDTAGGTAVAHANLTVNPGTSTTTLAVVSVSPPSTTVGPGLTQVFTAVGESSSGGVLSPVVFSWTLAPSTLGKLNASSGALVVFTASSTTGSGLLWVNGTYESGTPVSTEVPITVQTGAGAGAPSISSFQASPATFVLGSSTTLSVTAVGGTAPLAYSYAGLPTGCSSSNTDDLACTPTVTGNFTVTVTVTDAASKTASAVVALDVEKAPPTTGSTKSSSPSFFSQYGLYLLLLVVVAVAAIAAALLLRRRRKAPPTMAAAAVAPMAASASEMAPSPGGPSAEGAAAGVAGASADASAARSSDDVEVTPSASAESPSPEVEMEPETSAAPAETTAAAPEAAATEPSAAASPETGASEEKPAPSEEGAPAPAQGPTVVCPACLAKSPQGSATCVACGREL